MTNLYKYGSIYTPIFDLSKIDTVPIALISGEQDTLATPENAQWAKSKIKSVAYSKVLPNCDHSSFLVGKDMSFLHDVLKILSLHNSDVTLQSLYKIHSN
jgi:pimeloyl-ACP methyl ester carboxylesterase